MKSIIEGVYTVFWKNEQEKGFSYYWKIVTTSGLFVLFKGLPSMLGLECTTKLWMLANEMFANAILPIEPVKWMCSLLADQNACFCDI